MYYWLLLLGLVTMMEVNRSINHLFDSGRGP